MKASLLKLQSHLANLSLLVLSIAIQHMHFHPSRMNLLNLSPISKTIIAKIWLGEISPLIFLNIAIQNWNCLRLGSVSMDSSKKKYQFQTKETSFDSKLFEWQFHCQMLVHYPWSKENIINAIITFQLFFKRLTTYLSNLSVLSNSTKIMRKSFVFVFNILKVFF